MRKDESEKIEQEEYQKLWGSLSKEEKEEALELLHDPEKYKDLEKLWFISPPPSPEEFLDWRNGWFNKDYAEGIYPFVKQTFIDILNRRKNYKNISLYGSTGIGKSTIAHLLIFYIIVYFHHMRNPKAYLQVLANPAIYLLSFTVKKSVQLLMFPIYEMLKNSPRCMRVHSQKKVYDLQPEYGLSKIIWSSASDVGEITLFSGLQILLGSDALSIIGSTVFTMFVSEIAFFIEQEGTTEEEIFQIYTDGAGRIESRFPNNPYLSFIYLDTSCNNADSLIENYVINELQHNEGTYFSWKTRWEALPFRAPQYQKTGKTFKVITGNSKYPPNLNPTQEEIEKTPPELVVDVPIDFYNSFKIDLIKSIKDIAGRPTSSDSKLISNGQLIERIFDNPVLVNKIDLLKVDALVPPKDYIWNEISHMFFSLFDGKRWIINRAVPETRYVGLDNASSADGDIAGLTMGHYEWSRTKNCKIFVCDFTLAIGPGEHGISIDAMRQFILDIYNYSGLNIAGVAFDTHQTKSMEQFLLRNEIKAYSQHLSERTTEPYDFLVEQIKNDQIKAGRNIFLKNNLLNLEKKTVKNKTTKGTTSYTIIDHPIGSTINEYNGSWDKSQAGYYAKDVSDSLAQAVYLADKIDREAQPITIYEDENKKFQQIEMSYMGVEGVVELMEKMRMPLGF